MQLNDGGVACFEGEDHVPDGGSVEIRKSGSKAPWCPVKHRDVNCVGETAKEAEEKAVIGREYVGVEVLRNTGGLGRLCDMRALVWDHVGEGAVDCQCWIVMFVSMLSLPKVIDRGVFLF